MAFDAGSVVGHFKLDSSEWQAGAKQVTGHNAGMMSSVFKAQLAYDVFKQVLQKAVQIIKESVAEYAKHQLAVKQTETVLKSTGHAAGMTTAEVVGLSDSMMALTGIENDNVLQAENLLLTFTKIGKDVFPQATQTVLDMSVALGEDAKSAAIQLGKALQDPVLGINALRRVGVNFTTEQKALAKELVATGRSAEAQAMILKELQVEFGGSAAAARDTFSGALKNLTNQTDEVKESIGRYIATAGRPFIENMARSAQATAEWLNSAQGLQTVTNILVPLAGALAVVVNIGKSLWDLFVNLATGVIDDVKTGLANLFGRGNELQVVFTVLGGAVRVLSIGFTVLGKMVKVYIDYNINLIKVARESVGVLIALGDALAHPLDKSKWEAVGAAATKTWDAIKKLGLDAFNDVKDVVKTTIDEFKNFDVKAKETGALLQQTFVDAGEGMRRSMAQFKTSAVENLGEIKAAVVETTKNIGKSMEDLSRKNKKTTGDITMTWDEVLNAVNSYADGSQKHYTWTSDKIVKAMNALLQKAASDVGTYLSFVSSAVSQISAIYDMYYANEQTKLDNDYQKRKAYIEANVTDETEKQKQLAALEAEYKAKSNEIKKKQFESQKAASIVQAIIQTAQAVMQTFATFGWPWGIIPAAIMAGIGAAQVAMIASQTTPEFAAEGGVFPSGTDLLVGEQGPELLRLGATSRVVPSGQTSAFLGGGIVMHVTFTGDISREVDIDVATARMARRLKSALRAS